VTDVHAPYYGLEVNDERALVPGDNPRIGATRFADWLSRSTTKPATPHPYEPAEVSARPARPSRAWRNKMSTVRVPVDEWLFDPADAQRYEIGLHNLLGAVEALEGCSGRHRRTETEG
jgi:hypothetical protein